MNTPLRGKFQISNDKFQLVLVIWDLRFARLLPGL